LDDLIEWPEFIVDDAGWHGVETKSIIF